MSLRIKNTREIQHLGTHAQKQISKALGKSKVPTRASRIVTDPLSGVKWCPYPSPDPGARLHSALIQRYGSYWHGGDVASEMIIPGHTTLFRYDFALVSRRLVLEFDGYSAHKRLQQFKRDREKQRHAQVKGWQHLAITNVAVIKGLQGLLSDIEDLLSHRPIYDSKDVLVMRGKTQCVFIG